MTGDPALKRDQQNSNVDDALPAEGRQTHARDANQPELPETPEGHDPYHPYSLVGPQQDPEAANWTRGAKPLPHVVSIHSVLLLTTDPAHEDLFIPPYPKDQAFLDWEIAELAHLQGLRNDPGAIAGAFAAPAPPNSLPDDYLDAARTRVSDFMLLSPPPFGAILHAGGAPQGRKQRSAQRVDRAISDPDDGSAAIATGRDLALLFESETPGLIHRHALNTLLYRRPEISPPRQARVWMALDVAIYGALAAAWHYKWAADPTAYAFRQRPVEYDQERTFRVLYDLFATEVVEGGTPTRTSPLPSPGTPRSPSYPSAHSTYAAAATEVLAYFFPQEREELEILANNIGTSQLWAGVHWRSDVAAGQRLGRAVARRVIEQLETDCVPAFDDPEYSLPDSPAPDPSALRKRASARRNASPCTDAVRADILPSRRARGS